MHTSYIIYLSFLLTSDLPVNVGWYKILPFNHFITMSSLFKKYLMALTGIVLIGFVFVHMLGNLQILLGQESINAYAHALQSLPLPILWGSRVFLFVCVFLHALTAYLLIKENRAARPVPNEVEKTKRAGWSSLRMGLTGSCLQFIISGSNVHYYKVFTGVDLLTYCSTF